MIGMDMPVHVGEECDAVATSTGVPEIGDVLPEHTLRHSVPGAAIGILHDGITTTAYCGVADTVTGEPVTPETRFAVGSLGKSMAATVAVHLAEAGRWSLDDSVAAHVPELRGIEWARRATLLDLLANRSRVPLSVETEFAGWPDADDSVLSRFAAKIASGDPTPAAWSYTNAGWCLLGRAIEAVTGLNWEDAVKANLLDPLNMTQTTFTSWPHDVPRVSGHNITTDGPQPVPPWTPRSLGPAGSTPLSTVTDLLRFAGRHLDDPSLSPMRTTTANIRIHGWLDGWGLGWGRFDWESGPVWGWDGLTAGQRSVLRLVPHRQGAIVLLTNSGTGRALYRSVFPQLMRTYFGVGMPPLRLNPSPGTAGDLSRFAGVYAWPDQRWEVTANDISLNITDTHTTFDAWPIDEQTFLVDADDPDTPTMTFGEFDDQGRPQVLYEMLWAHPRI
jgi:CubicO group peptidase (beta-lactamase class C family)